MIYIDAVITNAYAKEPIWLTKELDLKEYVVLNLETSSDDIGLFFALLFDYNSIDYGSDINDSFNNLLDNETLIISGGPRFANDKIGILPSCCCGLEELQDFTIAISKKKSPWLGHDPTPKIDYLAHELTIIYSDDKLKNKDIDSIECSYDELLHACTKMNSQLEQFFNIKCKHYLAYYGLKNIDQVVQFLKECFCHNDKS